MYAIILRDQNPVNDAVFYALVRNRDEAFREARKAVRTDRVEASGWAEVQELNVDHTAIGWYGYPVRMTWSIPKPVAFNAAGTCPLDDNDDYLK